MKTTPVLVLLCALVGACSGSSSDPPPATVTPPVAQPEPPQPVEPPAPVPPPPEPVAASPPEPPPAVIVPIVVPPAPPPTPEPPPPVVVVPPAPQPVQPPPVALPVEPIATPPPAPVVPPVVTTPPAPVTPPVAPPVVPPPVVASSLVMYEGTANVVITGEEFRFRAVVETDGYNKLKYVGDGPTGIRYFDAIRDFDVWVDNVSLVLPATSTTDDSIDIHARGIGIPGEVPQADLLTVNWRGVADDGKVFGFNLRLEDLQATMLESHSIPKSIDFTLAEIQLISYSGGGRSTPMVLTSFKISPLLEMLGKSTEAAIAQSYYEVGDVLATCAMLRSFEGDDAAMIMGAMGC